jgi:hypothetical protein
MGQRSLSAGITLLGIISVIALTGGFGASWVLADDRSDRERGDRKTIVLIGTHQPGTLGLATEIKEPSTTNGVGNQNLFSDDLRYQKNGELAGRNSAVCTTTSPFGNPPDIRPAHRGANLCTLAFVFIDRGKITVSGIVTDEDFAAGGFVLPIVGGTDEFRHAQGEYELKFGAGHGVPATLTFRLK